MVTQIAVTHTDQNK